MRVFLRRFLRDDRGAVMPFAVLSMTVMTTAVMFSYNTGRLAADRIKLQNVADNAAMSAALAEANVLSTVAYNNQGIAFLYGKLIRYNAQVVVFGTQVNFAYLSLANKKVRWPKTPKKDHVFSEHKGFADSDARNMMGHFANHPHREAHKAPGKLWASNLFDGKTDDDIQQGFEYLAKYEWPRKIPQYRKELGALIESNRTALKGIVATATDTAHRVVFEHVENGLNLNDPSVHVWGVVDPYSGNTEPLDISLGKGSQPARPYFRWATWEEFREVVLPSVKQTVQGAKEIAPDYYDWRGGGPPVDHEPVNNDRETFYYTVACWEPWDWMHGESEYTEGSGGRVHLNDSKIGSDYRGGRKNPAAGHWHNDSKKNDESFDSVNGPYKHTHICRGRAPDTIFGPYKNFAAKVAGCGVNAEQGQFCTYFDKMVFGGDPISANNIIKQLKSQKVKEGVGYKVYGMQVFVTVWKPNHADVKKCYGHWDPVSPSAVGECLGQGQTGNHMFLGSHSHREGNGSGDLNREHRFESPPDHDYHHREYNCTLCDIPPNEPGNKCLLMSSGGHKEGAGSVQWHGYKADQFGGYPELEGGGKVIRLYLSESIEHFERGSVKGLSINSHPGIKMLVEQQFWRAWEVERPKKTPRTQRRWIPDDIPVKNQKTGALEASFTPLLREPDKHHLPVIVSVMATSPKSPWMPNLFRATTMVAVAAAQVEEGDKGTSQGNLYNPNWGARLVNIKSAMKEFEATPTNPSLNKATPWRGKDYRKDNATPSGDRVPEVQKKLIDAIHSVGKVEALH